MCNPLAVSIGMMVAGKAMQAYGENQSAKDQQRQAAINAKRADEAARDAILRGELDASRVGMRAAKVAGAQRAQAAGSNVEANSGTALALLEETTVMSALDKATVRANAAREARGLKMQAQDFRAEGVAAGRRADWALLGGGFDAASSTFRYLPEGERPRVKP